MVTSWSSLVCRHSNTTPSPNTECLTSSPVDKTRRGGCGFGGGDSDSLTLDLICNWELVS